MKPRRSASTSSRMRANGRIVTSSVIAGLAIKNRAPGLQGGLQFVSAVADPKPVSRNGRERRLINRSGQQQDAGVFHCRLTVRFDAVRSQIARKRNTSPGGRAPLEEVGILRKKLIKHL